MLETSTYVRKPFEIQAVRVTKENIAEVAEWCKGELRLNVTNVKAEGDTYIKVDVARPLTERQTEAYVGDWVLYMSKGQKGFKVYLDKAFKGSFQPKSLELYHSGAGKPVGVAKVVEGNMGIRVVPKDPQEPFDFFGYNND